MISTPELSWMALGPELAAAIGALVVLLVGLGRGSAARLACSALTLVALAAAVVLSIVGLGDARPDAFGGQVDSDELANAGRLIAYGCALVAALFALRGRPDDGRHGEFHALLLAAACGMGLLAASGSFVTLFVGLELFSIALYVLCALDAERATSLESGLKYLIIGGLSSAVLVYGIALTYGATGSFEFNAVGESSGRGVLLFTGAAMVLAGLGFKVSAAPLHWWTPDVYQGAPTIVTAFMSTATKAVAFVALARVLIVAYGPEADAWVPLVAALAVASIVVGNLGALVQLQLKRMLAYSSVAQAGYLLVGLVGWRESGVAALVYALMVYAVMTLGCFAYVLVRERQLGRDATWADLAGQGWAPTGAGSAPRVLPALALSVCMLSLAGIPPMAGFLSKFVLFGAAVEAGYAWLAVVGVIGSVVSLAYYLRAIVELYMRTPDAVRAEAVADVPGLDTAEAHHAPPGRGRIAGTLGVALAVGVLVLAVLPQPFFDVGCEARSSLGLGGRCAPSSLSRG